MYYSGYQFDDILIRLARVLLGAPTESPGGDLTKEIVNANLELRIPCRCVLTNPVRTQNKRYLERELQWYLLGTKEVGYIKEYAAKWGEIANADGSVNSAYGWQIFSQETPSGGSQFDYIVKELRNDLSSRRAVININQIIHKCNTKDVPCTLTIQFLVRKNCLVQIATMRSTDFVWGLCNDVPFFAMLQMKIGNELLDKHPSLLLGSLFLNTGSLHVYERHFEVIDKLGNLNGGDRYVSDCLSKYLDSTQDLSGQRYKGNCCEGFSVALEAKDDGNIETDVDYDDPKYLYPLI